jgi:hypothetical protein
MHDNMNSVLSHSGQTGVTISERSSDSLRGHFVQDGFQRHSSVVEHSTRGNEQSAMLAEIAATLYFPLRASWLTLVPIKEFLIGRILNEDLKRCNDWPLLQRRGVYLKSRIKWWICFAFTFRKLINWLYRWGMDGWRKTDISSRERSLRIL